MEPGGPQQGGDEPPRYDGVRATLTRQLDGVAVGIDAVVAAAELLVRCFAGGGKLLIFGNGGSAACAQHLATELVCRMARVRPPLPAIALTTDTSLLTAIANDFGFERVFARQVEALGRPQDVVLAISTSGRSANVLAAVAAARRLDIPAIGLAGRGPSPLHQLADVAISVAADDAARVQEAHLAVQHALCGSVETALFGDAVVPAQQGDSAVQQGDSAVQQGDSAVQPAQQGIDV